MNINLSPNAVLGVNINGRISADVALPPLGDEESITARVIFSSGDTVHLKTEDGALIRARLEGGVVLPEGGEVTLTVADKSADKIILRLVSAEGSAATAPAATRMPALPPALQNVFRQLQSANLPIAQKLEIFGKALADFSGLNVQEPAVQEALAQLSMQTTTPTAGQQPTPGLGQLLNELAALLNSIENTTAPQGQQPPATAPQGQQPSATVPQGQTPVTTPVLNAEAAPAPQAPATPAPTAATPAPATTGATIAPEAPLPTAVPNAPAASSAATNAAPNAPVMPEATATPAEPANSSAPTASAQANVPAANTAGAAPDAPAATNAATAELAAPAASAAPAPPLAPAQQQQARQFAQQVLAELYPAQQQALQPRQVANFVSSLFARLGQTAEQGAEALQKNARELEARLTILKEALEHSQLPQREELLNHTTRILQQTEALRENRLLCLQVPIQFEHDRKTAELYIYRRERQGGKKLDPQNATVLLALNTEHLGRLEALIQTRGKEINLKMEIARAEAVPFVREQAALLPQLLKDAGFRLHLASVGPLQRPTDTPQEAERALESFQRSFTGKLDFFI